MTAHAFAAELAQYGPQTEPSRNVSLAEAEDYCRRLARSHYENFTVASWLLPRALRQHFYNVYAYCRWADDLADEVHDPVRSLALLDWWERELRAVYDGRAKHPVLIALAATIRRFHIRPEPFVDLLAAFRQDQSQARYETIDDLLAYCRHSANPVGRLVLYLGECHDAELVELSDQVCMGLQLANFWQDVARDWDRGRVYLPLEDCRRYGYELNDFEQRRATPAFRRMLAERVEHAESLLRSGMPLVGRVTPALRIDVSLFIRGGLAILAQIRRIDYDVWKQRPTVGRWAKLRLLVEAWRGADWEASGGAAS